MNASRLLLLFVLLPVGTALVSPAYATPAPVVTASDKTASDRADELATRALVFANKDQPAEAEPLLREAWGLKHSYDIAANLGIVDVALNKWCDAAELLTYAVKTFPVNGKPEHRKLLELTLAKVLPHVAALTIKVNVDKAEVFVDGKSVGVAPLSNEVFLEPGTRKIEARLQGYDVATQTVEAVKGGSSETPITLRPTAAAPPPLGTAPPLHTEDPPPDPSRRVVIGVGVGAAAVALGLGVAFTVVANGKAADASTMRGNLAKIQPNACGSTPAATDCQTLHGLWSDRATFGNAAAWSFIGAGVLGAATVGFALLGPKRSSKTEIQAIPAVGPGTAGLIVHGAW